MKKRKTKTKAFKLPIPDGYEGEAVFFLECLNDAVEQGSASYDELARNPIPNETETQRMMYPVMNLCLKMGKKRFTMLLFHLNTLLLAMKESGFSPDDANILISSFAVTNDIWDEAPTGGLGQGQGHPEGH